MPHNIEDLFRVKTVVQRYQGKQLEWGKYDCMTFCLEIQQALHGIDTEQYWKGKYNSFRGAFKWVKTHYPDGKFTLNPMMDDYEEIEVEATELELGDTVLTYNKGLPHAAVYYERLWWSVWEEEGFAYKVVNNNTKYKVWRRKCHK